MTLCYSLNNSIGKKQNTTTKATWAITQTTTSIWPSQSHWDSQIVPELPFLKPLHRWRCILFWNLVRQLPWNATLSSFRHNKFNSGCEHLALASKNMLWQRWDMWSEEMMIKCSNPKVCSPCFIAKCGIYGCIDCVSWILHFQSMKTKEIDASQLFISLGISWLTDQLCLVEWTDQPKIHLKINWFLKKHFL